MKYYYNVFPTIFLVFAVFFLSGALFSAQAQSIVSVDPDSAYVGETVVVTITGENTRFQEGTEVIDYVYLAYWSYTIIATDVLVHSPILLEATFDLSSPYYVDEYYTVCADQVGDWPDEVFLYDGFRILGPTKAEDKSWGNVKSIFR